MAIEFIDAESASVLVAEAVPDEALGLRADWLGAGGQGRELYTEGVYYGAFPHYLHLGKAVAEWFLAVEQFVEDDPDGPDIDLLADILLTLVEHLWRQVPVGPDPKGSQVDHTLLLLDRLADPKVDDLGSSLVEEHVGGFEIEMDNSYSLGPEIVHHKGQLLDDPTSLLFGQTPPASQVAAQIRPRAVLQHDGMVPL